MLAAALAGCGGGGDGPIAVPGSVQQLTVSPGTFTVQVGQTAQFAAAVVVTGSASSGVTWALSNPAVATMTVSGNSVSVTGNSAGTTDVTAISQFDGAKRAVATLTVVPIPGSVQSLSVTPASASVPVGQAVQLTASIRATGGASRAVSFSSGDTTIATVSWTDSVATVRGVAPGTARITVTSLFDTTLTTTSTITVTAAAAGACTLAGTTATVAIGQTLTGTLVGTDCLLGDGTYADVYRLAVATSQALQIDMTSTALDSYLFLLDANGALVAADDNSGGGSNARITRPLSAGTYYVVANNFAPGTGGAYTLSVRPAAACTTATVVGPIGVGQTVTGTLASTDCTLSDGAYADLYRVTITASQALQIDMTSSAFDSFLIVFDANGAVVATDDDSGGGLNARITRTLTPGTYYVAAKSEAPGATGAYTLTVR